jgi:aminopeptidase N
VAGWLSGEQVLDGLTVDTDLRWRLLQALVAHGAAGEAEIVAEHQRDATSAGERQAERARALIPTLEAKERAWQRAVHDDDLPNAVNDAIISGFSHPAQRGLLTEYVDRYFAEVSHMVATPNQRPGPVGGNGLFPSWAVDKHTADTADAWLNGAEHPPAQPRLVSQGRAGVIRALAAREFDQS